MSKSRLKSICQWRKCQGDNVKGSVVDLQEYREKKLRQLRGGQRSGLTRFLGGLLIGFLMIGVFSLGMSAPQEEGFSQAGLVDEPEMSQPVQFNSTSLLFIGLALAGLGLWGTSNNKRRAAAVPIKKQVLRKRSTKRFFVTD